MAPSVHSGPKPPLEAALLPVALHRHATARLFLMAGVAAAFTVAWRHFNSIPLLVLGQPQSVGLLQRDQEMPFFKNLAATTGLPLSITYRSADSFGLKDTHQLEAIHDGRVDIVSLRFMQNIAKEPSLEGLDLPGMIHNFKEARQVADAYGPTVDRYLQQTFGAKLLGIWTFGPQIMVCRTPIQGLQDVKGRKVRVASPGLAQLTTAIGGIPAILPFEDTKESLALGLVDCAVTSAASANFAGWTQHSNYYYPLAFQFGFNGYAISLKKWQALSHNEQDRLARAFQDFSSKLWHYSEKLEQESESCILGGPCHRLRPNQLIPVAVKSQDIELLQNLSKQAVLPSWLVRCEKQHPGCGREWQQKVAPIVQFTSSMHRQP